MGIWHATKDRLPTKSGLYIVTDGSGFVEARWYFLKHEDWDAGDCEESEYNDGDFDGKVSDLFPCWVTMEIHYDVEAWDFHYYVTEAPVAWMKMPKPYEGK